MSEELIEEYYPIKYDIYHVVDGKHSKEDITIYEDDSIQEIYYKISSKEKVSYEYIHLWYFDEENNYNLLGYKYEEIKSLKDLYSLKEDEYINEVVNEDGLQFINAKNYNLHKTLENIFIEKNHIYYTTLQEYFSYIKLKPKDIEPEKWSREIKYLDFINGKIRVYWPELTEKMIIEQKNKELNKRVKRITKIVKNTEEILHKIYSFKEILKPENISMNTFIVSNKIDEDNIVNIAQLFTDIKLEKFRGYNLVLSKIMMESYDDSHYKVHKEAIKDKNYPKNPLSEGDFIRLTKGIVISLVNLKVRYLDFRRSVTFVFHKDNLFIQLNINDRGEIKLIIESFIVDEIEHVNIIRDMNSFIQEKIISQMIYFGLDKKIKLISDNLNNNYDNSINLMNYGLEYNIKNFDLRVLEKMINNLSVFLRIENISDSKIHIVYKRVNEYNSIAGRLKIISKICQETDKREEIISRIADIFNILDEDAIENYEIWKQMSKKGYKNVQEGVDIIIEGFKSSHMRINVGGCSSKREMIRINHLFNTLMSCYFEFIEKKNDRLSLMKRKKLDEDLLDLSDDDEMVITEQQTDSGEKSSEETSVDEDSGSSESIDMGLLEELDSDDEDLYGGYSSKIEGGGYDLRSYYLNRLSKNAKYDNSLFKFKSGKNTTNTKKGVVFGTYARACSANYSRHPIALTGKELNEIKDNPDYGEGIGYSNAIKIDGRPTTINGDIYYICPKYWDVKNETPLDPLKLDDFREHVFGMDYSKNPSGDPIKTTSKDKANSEKYVLVRSGYHWTHAGDNIMRYKVESMKNVHPDGFDVPCCNIERLEKISKNDKIEWFDEKDKTWNKGVCIEKGSDKDDKKPYLIKTNAGDKIKISRRFIKKLKENNHISNSLPCNDSKYCHINENLKIYIGQHTEMPKKGESDRGIYKLGLVRKGVKKSSDSLLNTLCELLNKKDTNELITHMIKDLYLCDNLFKISNGSFVNNFYSELKDINDNDVKIFIKYLMKQIGIVKRHKEILLKNDMIKENLFRGTPLMVSLNNHYYRVFSSIINFEKYLKDNTNKEDKYLVSILCSIMKINENMTFGEKKDDISILVLEEINNDILIKEPVGGFKKDFDKLYLIYKYRDNYEPIFINLFEEYKTLIDPYNIKSKYEETIDIKINNSFESISEFLKNIIESLKILLIEGKKKSFKQLPGALEIMEIMNETNLEIISCIYDDYGFIRYIETQDNCLIPVKPTSLEDVDDVLCKYILTFKNRGSYINVNKILRKIDNRINKELYLGYLDNINVNVIEYYSKETIKGKNIRKHGFYIKEIIINKTSFIPVEKTLYKKSEHYDILYKGEINEIDNYISKGGYMIDKMKSFLINNNYKKRLYEYLSRRTYILYLTEKSLQESIQYIKSLTFMKNYHKYKKVYILVDKLIRKSCIFKNEEYDESLEIQTNDKIQIYNIGEISCEIIYYKIMMFLCSFFINYSNNDYNRFVGANINEEILSKSIKEDELYFNHNEIELQDYKYLFSNKSVYIRKSNLYGNCLTVEQYKRLIKMKDTNDIKVDFDKKYPKIINEYIHKNSLVLKYDNVSKYDILQMGLKDEEKISKDELIIIIEEIIDNNEKKEWILDENEMNILELFKGIIGNNIKSIEDIKNTVQVEKITIPEIYILSYIFKKGFNIVYYNKDNTIDIKIVINPKCIKNNLEETEIISLIQTNNYLGNISIRNELVFPLDSYSKKYYTILRKQNRRLYDILKANTTPIKK